MIYTPSDLQIFIMTFNRPDFVQSAVKSLNAQSVKGFEIIVLDNSKNDLTAAKKPFFESCGAKYVRTPDILLANFETARRLANRKFCMLFHDDDLLHPQYIETALKCLNKFEGISLLSGGCTNFTGKEPVFTAPLKNEAVIYKDVSSLAAHVFSKNMFNYPCCIYKTEFFKYSSSLFDIYHKNNDLPFILSIAQKGSSAVIWDDKCVYTRQHPLQDCKNAANGTELKNLYAWIELFYKYLSAEGKESPLYKAYCVQVYNNLKNAYGYLKQSEKDKVSFEALLADLQKKGFIDEYIITLGRYRENICLRLSSSFRRFSWRWRAPERQVF